MLLSLTNLIDNEIGKLIKNTLQDMQVTNQSDSIQNNTLTLHNIKLVLKCVKFGQL